MNLKTFAFAAATATFGLVGAASATTLATFDIYGDYAIVTTAPTGPSTFDVDGTFRGEVLAPFPTGDTDYTLSASITIDGGSQISASDSVTVTFDIDDAVFFADLLLDELILNADTLIPFPGGTVEYGGALNAGDPANVVSGTYFINADFDDPIGPQVDAVLDLLDPNNLVFPSVFNFPNNDSGNFNINLSISADVAAVPLPAAFPMLAVGMLGFGVIARRRKT